MGKYFKTSQEFQKIFTELFEKILKDPEQNSTIKSLNKTLTVNFTDPDIQFTIKTSEAEKGICVGGNNQKADIKMWMSTDTAHRLLLGKLNPMAAVISNEIRVVGPFHVMNNVVKVFSVANRLYREVLVENDMEGFIE